MKLRIIVITTIALILSLFIQSCSEQVPTGKTNSDTGTLQQRVINSSSGPYIMRDAQGNLVTNLPGAGAITPLFGHDALSPSHVRGARIYDDFTIELAMPAPGTNPLAALAEGVIPGGEWLCSSCHGYDYEGTVTFNGGGEINLQDLIPIRGRDEEYVIHMLNSGFAINNNGVPELVHNYNGILTPQAMVDVADFVVNEIYDTHQVVSAATGIGLGDMMEGNEFYNDSGVALPTGVPAYIRADGTFFNCIQCHDGVISTLDGTALKALAMADPFKFLHRTNFGSPRDEATFGFGYQNTAVMPGLYEVVLTDGLHFGGPEQAGAIMHYIQMNPAF